MFRSENEESSPKKDLGLRIGIGLAVAIVAGTSFYFFVGDIVLALVATIFLGFGTGISFERGKGFTRDGGGDGGGAG